MARTMIEVINALPVGTCVEVRCSSNGSTSWTTNGDNNTNKLLLGRLAKYEVARTSEVHTCDGVKIVLYGVNWYKQVSFYDTTIGG